MLKSAGLADYGDFIEGDALASLDELPGTFDFVLIDLWKDLYIPCLDRLHPKLAAGGMILADNMIFPPENEENRSEEHTSELQSLMRNSYAVFCLKNKNYKHIQHKNQEYTI